MTINNGQMLVNHVVRAINLAELGISKLHPDIYYIDGMSSPKGRRLLNELCSLPSCNYLEIGCWKGSTLVSALYDNQDSVQKAVAIDSFGEFQEPLFVNSINFDDSPVRNPHVALSIDPIKKQLDRNINSYLDECFCSWAGCGGKSAKLKFHDIDCFNADFLKDMALLYPDYFNVYFYDGNHEEEAQYQAFVSYDKVFAKQFIAVVDDWNNKNAENGTRRAFKDLGYNILCEAILPANGNGDVFLWWAGMAVFVLEKQ